MSIDRLISTKITLRIPKDFHNEPVISRLVSEHGLTINISAAMMGEDVQEEGWFKLELRGTQSQLDSALTFLDDLSLEFWRHDNQETEGW